MSISISIADVLTRAAFRTHLPTFGPGQFVTSPDALMIAQDAVSRLGSMLLLSFGDAYFAQTATLQTQAGLDLVSLPAGFSTLRTLHFIDGTHATLLKRAFDQEYHVTPRPWNWRSEPRYRIEGNVLVFTPIPDAVYTLRCAYTTGLSIASATDTIQGQPGWSEWLVLDCIEQILDRSDKDATRYTARKADVERKLKEEAKNRDRGGVMSPRDVTGQLDDFEHAMRRRNGYWRGGEDY